MVGESGVEALRLYPFAAFLFKQCQLSTSALGTPLTEQISKNDLCLKRAFENPRFQRIEKNIQESRENN